ncbi:MAG: four helix bundle protein [Myxococcota bacterium]|jgi:four helix bundle protein|nr:four helix bundle protein [Myxococcota bacterium]MBP8971132.1 four helix bundle protein [Myxococcota bacterium]HQC44889.1 four helix bundle protein [Myxococcota bacterium]HQL57098.1 four helix bundle protein [Myxococcota bacterium]
MKQRFDSKLNEKTAGPMQLRLTAAQEGPSNRLRAVARAVELARDVERLVRKIRRHRNLVDQVTRAAESIPLNLAEGAGRSGKDKTYHYKIAYASAGETLAALEILLAYEAINDRQFESLAKQIDEIRAITWRLIQR